MIANWSDWKRFPDPARGDHIAAPIGPGLYEVRYVSSGALFAFNAADNVARALSLLPSKPGFLKAWFARPAPMPLADLEYRTYATPTKALAATTAARMIGRRDTFMHRAA